jgi:hypothetical protein
MFGRQFPYPAGDCRGPAGEEQRNLLLSDGLTPAQEAVRKSARYPQISRFDMCGAIWGQSASTPGNNRRCRRMESPIAVFQPISAIVAASAAPVGPRGMTNAAPMGVGYALTPEATQSQERGKDCAYQRRLPASKNRRTAGLSGQW